MLFVALMNSDKEALVSPLDLENPWEKIGVTMTIIPVDIEIENWGRVLNSEYSQSQFHLNLNGYEIGRGNEFRGQIWGWEIHIPNSPRCHPRKKAHT